MNNTAEKNKRKQYVWSKLTSGLFGLSVEIKKSSSVEMEGIKGVVEDETANLLKIQTKSQSVWVPKDCQIFEIELNDGTKVIVDGAMIKGKPENRIKRKLKNW